MHPPLDCCRPPSLRQAGPPETESSPVRHVLPLSGVWRLWQPAGGTVIYKESSAPLDREHVAGYLRLRRPPASGRVVFLRAFGPAAPMSRQAAVGIPRRAAARAGLPAVGAHRLRHRAATLVVSNGGSLAEAAQLLRHGSEAVTAIYAKIDRAALAPVTRPWPEA